MKNWSTNEGVFTDSKSKRIWELEQQLNFGTDNDKVSKEEVIKYWDNLKDKINPYTRRLLEYLIWGKLYSLPTNLKFWNWSGKPKA